MALIIERALGMINYAVGQRAKNELRFSDFIQNELQDCMQYYLSNDNLSNLELVEFENGFYLGEMQNGRRNGFGIQLWYKDGGYHNFYMGHWSDDYKHGDDGFYCMDNAKTYFGGFVNGNFEGEDGYIVDNSGLLIHAVFQQGEIVKVKDNNSSFTYNGKSFDEKGKTSDNNSSCWGCFSIIIIIALLFGVYSYCSSWFDTQKVEQHQQDEFKSATIYVCMAKSGLIVRLAPDASSRKIGSLKAGEEVEVYDIIKDYAKIKFNGDIGYANIKYLEKK